MTIEASIYTRLSTFAGLTALVGTRIYRPILPTQVTLPAVAFFRVSAPREGYTMGTDGGMPRSRWQFTAWAETVDGGSHGQDIADAVAAQIILALERWQDISAGVQDTELVSDVDLHEPDTLEYGRAVDVRIAEVFP
jgi:hypothetical protein